MVILYIHENVIMDIYVKHDVYIRKSIKKHSQLALILLRRINLLRRFHALIASQILKNLIF